MRILAIDPGTTESALVTLDTDPIAIIGAVKLRNEDAVIAVEATTADVCVIEMIGHYGTGMPAGREVFHTCVWIGRFIERRMQNWKTPPRLILRPTVKTHICGTSRAKDGNVRQAIIDRLGAPGRKASPGPTYGISGDEWQALAVALTYADKGDAACLDVVGMERAA